MLGTLLLVQAQHGTWTFSLGNSPIYFSCQILNHDSSLDSPVVCWGLSPWKTGSFNQKRDWAWPLSLNTTQPAEDCAKDKPSWLLNHSHQRDTDEKSESGCFGLEPPCSSWSWGKYQSCKLYLCLVGAWGSCLGSYEMTYDKPPRPDTNYSFNLWLKITCMNE